MVKKTSVLLATVILLTALFGACAPSEPALNTPENTAENTAAVPAGTENPEKTPGESEAAETAGAASAAPATGETAKPQDATAAPGVTQAATPKATPVVTATPKPTAAPTPKPTAAQTPKPTSAPTAKPAEKTVDYDNCGKGVGYCLDSVWADSKILCVDGKGTEYLSSVNYDIAAGGNKYSTLTVVGWIGFTEKIAKFGYIIDNGAAVYGDFANEAEAAVKANNNGGEYAQRFAIVINVGGLGNGTHTICAVAKLASGDVVKMNGSKAPVEFTYTVGSGSGSDSGTGVGLDITNKTDLVGICYTIWFEQILGTKLNTSPISYPYNVEELTKKYGFSSANGFGKQYSINQKFYYWAEPAQGYYHSIDPVATKNNMKLIAEAGVDFIVVDMTYATAAWAVGTTWTNYIYNPTKVLLNTITEMRANGEKAPYVVFWTNNNSDMVNKLNSTFVKAKKWKDCFVYWNDKPFMLVWSFKSDTQYPELTVKGMNGLSHSKSENQWSYLETDNSQAACKTHIPVCVAAQTTYMSYYGAVGRNGGRTFYNQWKNAFNLHPKIVTVTWWNEWAAQLMDNSITGVGYQFTDNFNMEYSRDIEPMKGGHGDQYYKWLCSYVKAYKAHEACPKNYN